MQPPEEPWFPEPGKFADTPAMGGVVMLMTMFNSRWLRAFTAELEATMGEHIARMLAPISDAALRRDAIDFAADGRAWAYEVRASCALILGKAATWADARRMVREPEHAMKHRNRGSPRTRGRKTRR